MKRNRKFLTIGHRLVEGPDAIFPPGDKGWLEKDISINVRYYGDNRIQHASLWSDSTMNKYEGFFKPVIRFAHWEMNNDVERFKSGEEVTWPDVRIFLGEIKDAHFDELEDSLIGIQKMIPQLHFQPLGISLHRDVADIKDIDGSMNIELWVRNGVQAFSYSSPVIRDNVLLQKLVEMKNLMIKSIREIDYSGWKEKYASELTSASYYWDYKKGGM